MIAASGVGRRTIRAARGLVVRLLVGVVSVGWAAVLGLGNGSNDSDRGNFLHLRYYCIIKIF